MLSPIITEKKQPFVLELEALFCDVESATGIRVCVHDYGYFSRHELPKSRYRHNSSFCEQVKTDVVGARNCWRCDMGDAVTEAGEADEPFLRFCHAGICEVLVPVKDRGKLVGIIFCGQVFLDRKLPDSTAPEEIVRTVPVVSEEKLMSTARVIWRFILANASIISALVDIQRPSQFAHRKIGEALELLERRFTEPMTVGDVSRTVGLSVSYFEHLFKKEVGVSFTAWRQNRRIREAMRFLDCTNIKACEIATRVGFDDSAYFHRLFKEKTGVSPQVFRQRVSQAAETPRWTVPAARRAKRPYADAQVLAVSA